MQPIERMQAKVDLEVAKADVAHLDKQIARCADTQRQLGEEIERHERQRRSLELIIQKLEEQLGVAQD
jgi:chromosome segregation ATPase